MTRTVEEYLGSEIAAIRGHTNSLEDHLKSGNVNSLIHHFQQISKIAGQAGGDLDVRSTRALKATLRVAWDDGSGS